LVLTYDYTKMHGQQNIKKTLSLSQIWECLLSFGSQSSLFPFAVYDYKD